MHFQVIGNHRDRGLDQIESLRKCLPKTAASAHCDTSSVLHARLKDLLEEPGYCSTLQFHHFFLFPGKDSELVDGFIATHCRVDVEADRVDGAP